MPGAWLTSKRASKPAVIWAKRKAGWRLSREQVRSVRCPNTEGGEKELNKIILDIEDEEDDTNKAAEQIKSLQLECADQKEDRDEQLSDLDDIPDIEEEEEEDPVSMPVAFG